MPIRLQNGHPEQTTYNSPYQIPVSAADTVVFSLILRITKLIDQLALVPGVVAPLYSR